MRGAGHRGREVGRGRLRLYPAPPRRGGGCRGTARLLSPESCRLQSAEADRGRAGFPAPSSAKDPETRIEATGAMTMTTYSLVRSLSQAEFDLFARISGDNNPIHVDPEFSARTRFGRTVSHGMLLYTVLWG